MDSAQLAPDWIEEARHKLIRLFSNDCGWGYKRDGTPCTEPTALACLALKATRAEAEGDPPVVDKAARWLASIQQPNGAVGVSQALLSPEWPTPYAILAWSGQKEYKKQTEKAAKWLLECKGAPGKKQPEISPEDTTIVGWPWVTQTHSWLEPTAMAVLALRKQGLQHHERVREGLRLIVNRSIPTGGWNYGNSIIYGSPLRPQPTDTGMALTALRGVHDADAMISSAWAYLQGTIPDLRAPQSLCWAILGLRAWEHRPSDAQHLLRRAYEDAIRQSASSPQLSYLLLAASDRSLELLGIDTDIIEASL